MKKLFLLLLTTASTTIFSMNNQPPAAPQRNNRVVAQLNQTRIAAVNASYLARLNQLIAIPATPVQTPAPTNAISTRKTFTAAQVSECIRALNRSVVAHDDLERYFAQLSFDENKDHSTKPSNS